jgi:hypothetical protein
MATVTKGALCGHFAISRAVSTGMFDWIFHAHASA